MERHWTDPFTVHVDVLLDPHVFIVWVIVDDGELAAAGFLDLLVLVFLAPVVVVFSLLLALPVRILFM